MSRDSPRHDSRITRRTLLATTGLGIGGGVYYLLNDASQPALAIEMDTLTFTGEEVTLSEPPSALPVQVAGEFTVDSTATFDHARVAIAAIYDGVETDLGYDMFFEDLVGRAFTLETDLLEHEAIAAEDIYPGSAVIDFVLYLRIVHDGEIIEETSLTDSATLALNETAFDLAIGGEGNVTVETPA